MDVAVIGRVRLIPPKGILAELKPVVESKFNGSELKYARDFRIPTTKRPLNIEVVVDDDCEVCPVAVEFVSEIASQFTNVNVSIYNMSYVKPPFEPIVATPAFRINGVVRFTGIPLDPESMSRHFSEYMKEAYVRSHPKIEWLTDRLKEFAERYGYQRNPNDVAYLNLIYKLLRNIDEYGHPYCPCRPLRRVAGATPEKLYELNKDKVCPCIYVHTDIRKYGHCLCGMFWTKEKVDEYVRKRLERYGWVLKEIEWIDKALEVLKKRLISGRARVVVESIINKLQDIYVALDS